MPVLSVWLLKSHHAGHAHKRTFFDRLRQLYESVLGGFVRLRWVMAALYLAGSAAIIVLLGLPLGRGIFPTVDAGQFRLRMRAPDGTHIVQTEKLAKDALEIVADEVGRKNVELTLGLSRTQLLGALQLTGSTTISRRFDRDFISLRNREDVMSETNLGTRLAVRWLPRW